MYNKNKVLIQKILGVLENFNGKDLWSVEDNCFVMLESVITAFVEIKHALMLRLGYSLESDLEIISTLFPNWNRELYEAINSCKIGNSATVSQSLNIPFADGSSLTYDISAKINSSSASIAGMAVIAFVEPTPAGEGALATYIAQIVSK